MNCYLLDDFVFELMFFLLVCIDLVVDFCSSQLGCGRESVIWCRVTMGRLIKNHFQGVAIDLTVSTVAFASFFGSDRIKNYLICEGNVTARPEQFSLQENTKTDSG